MNTKIGVWIDHRNAVICGATGAADGQAAGLKHVTTDLERQLHLSAGKRAKTANGTQISPADDVRQAGSQHNLQQFFDEVIAAIGAAPSIFIFGPGEAKEEFKKRLQRDGLGGRIDGIESAEKMSDPQIAAKVREHFHSAA